jgi:hypothetical protein
MAEEKAVGEAKFDIDLLQEWAQALIEVMASGTLLEHIPGARTVRSIVKGVLSVRDAVLLRKIDMFLGPLREASPDERAEMIDRLERDPNYNRRVGTHLVELLDRVDSHRKPVMLGYCFQAFMQRKIDILQLQRLTSAVERLPTLEIDAVRKFAESANNQPLRSQLHPESIQALVNAGLAHWAQAAPIGGSVKYDANQTCALFLDLNLDVRSRPGASH